uniref:Uncharacterized protein n=1 Tax=Anguilla anguilla TaxID=7936 RepID=A0A0E9R6E7_ANGAN
MFYLFRRLRPNRLSGSSAACVRVYVLVYVWCHALICQ